MTLPRLDLDAFHADMENACTAFYECLEVTASGYGERMDHLRTLARCASIASPDELNPLRVALAEELQEHAQALAEVRNLFCIADLRAEAVINLALDAALKLKLEAAQESPA